MRKTLFLIVVTAVGALFVGCSGTETKPIAGNDNSSPAPATSTQPVPPVAVNGVKPGSTPNTQAANIPKKSPLTNVTAKDIAKLKWLTGSYKGTGGQPFFNKYSFNGTTLSIESYDDEAMTKLRDKSTFELKDGMYANAEGKDRFAASEITDDRVEFVAITDKYALLTFERAGDGTFKASLDAFGSDGNPNHVSYIMEPLKK